MTDPFSGGTPWDDAPSTPSRRPDAKPDFSSQTPWDAPKAKRAAQQGPIFQAYGQKAKKIKAPKPAKQKKTGDERPSVMFETIVRAVWKTLRILRTISVVIFLLFVALFTYAFAMGATGNPWVYVGPLPGLGVGVHELAPLTANVVGMALAGTIAGAVAVSLSRPHGKFREFTTRSWIWAALAVFAFPVLLCFLSWLFGTGAHALTEALPTNWHWVFDQNSPPPVGTGAPGSSVPTTIPTTHPTP